MMKRRMKAAGAFVLVALLFVVSAAGPCQAGDWYFRPRDGGPYGAGNGADYGDAWHRPEDIDWAAMRPGDTLYVLGKHLGGIRGNRGFGDCTAAGVTISGKHPAHPREQGVIVPAHFRYGQAHWTCEGQGVYSGTANTRLTQAVEFNAATGVFSHIRLVEDRSGLAPGSFCLDQGAGVAVWMPSDGTVQGKEFLQLSSECHSQVSAPGVTVTGVRYCGATKYGYKPALQLNAGADGAAVKGNSFSFCLVATGCPANISRAPCGVTIEGNTCEEGRIFLFLDSDVSAFKRWSVVGNTIRGMDKPEFAGPKDNEVFYLQGVQDCVFRGNLIDGYLGGALDFYAVSSKDSAVPITGNVVEKNVIRNGKYKGAGSQMTGLLISCDNSQWDVNRADPFYGNVFRYNIIHSLDADGRKLNYKAAIRLKARKPKFSGGFSWYVYNNVVYDVKNGMYAVEVKEGVEGPSDLYLVNNIFAKADLGFQHAASGIQSGWLLDHNVWYSVRNLNSFELSGQGLSYAEWADALKGNGADGRDIGGAEDHSIQSRPMFRVPRNGDFRLRIGSPCIDAGMPVPFGPEPVTDLDGGPVPLGLGVDMGAYELRPGP